MSAGLVWGMVGWKFTRILVFNIDEEVEKEDTRKWFFLNHKTNSNLISLYFSKFQSKVGFALFKYRLAFFNLKF